MSIGFRLGGPDKVSIRSFQDWPNGICLSPLITEHTRELTDFLIGQYFENGAALFGRESAEEMEMVRAAVGEPFAMLEVREIYRFVQYYVLRVRNYAHLGTMSQAMIRHAIVRGSCHEEHFVTIADAVSWVKWFQKLSTAEYARRVFGKDFGFPPFDIDCRCRMEGLIEGTDDFHQLNSARKPWRWFKGHRKGLR